MSQFFDAAILLILAFALFTLGSYGRHLMSTQATIDAVVAQLAKVKDELVSKIEDLNLQIADADLAEVIDTSELTSIAQALDDIVPDAEAEAS